MSPILGPLIAPWRSRLEGQIRATGHRVADPAIDGLVSVLERRVGQAVGPVLGAEARAAQAVGGTVGGTAADWAWRLDAYGALPGLLERIGTNWLGSTLEMLARIDADRTELQARVGGPLGALVGVRSEAGDPHDCGRSVAVLDFEGGPLVYKPKDLALVEGVWRFVDWLGERGLRPVHRRPVLWCREGYAWEGFVGTETCRDVDELRAYFLRFGALMRVFQLLGTRDLWLDNLVAQGPYPVFIDLEMVLHPPKPVRGRTAAETRAAAAMDETVLPQCGVVLHVPIRAGVVAEDLGALAPAGRSQLPFRADPHEERALGRPEPGGFRTFEHQVHAPTLDGQPVDPTEWIDALDEGYRRAQAVLLAERDGLKASPLAGLRGCAVRYVHRSTWDGYHRNRASVAPRVLRSEDSREAWLQGRRSGPLQDEEARATRDLEIPYFTCPSDGRGIRGPGGLEVPELFEASAWERLQGRIGALDALDVDAEVGWIRGALATGAWARWTTEPLDRTPDLDRAIALGHALVDAGIWDGASLAWTGWVHEPMHGFVRLGVLPPDVASGSAGLAVVLAELHRASGVARFREAAIGALQSSLASLDAPVSRGPLGEPVAIGLFVGLGAAIDAVITCARLLDLPDADRAVQGWVVDLPVESLCEQASVDVICGSAGLLVALLETGPVGRGVAERLAAALDRRMVSAPPSPIVGGHPALVALPGTDAGLAACSQRVRERLGLEVFWGQFGESCRPLRLRSALETPDFNRSAVHGQGAEIRAYMASKEVSSAAHEVLKMVHQSSVMPRST